jgi:ectoine hydroxylase-related dioxygenase (phytanoyl-CoA dioxygenase family)
VSAIERISSPMRDFPLSGAELLDFYRVGFLRLGRILDDRLLAQLRGAVADGRVAGEDDLLDPSAWPEGEGGVPQEPGRNVSFLFNLWRRDDRYRDVALDARLGMWAAQVLGATRVRLLEDNALTKDPHTGGELKWHQDYSYWPLGQPNAVTIWIALDDVTVENGAVKMAPGSHLLGERLPRVFGTGATYFRERRPPSVREIGEPEDEGLDVEAIELKAGEATIHHALTWHASGANSTDRARSASVFRYVADGTRWFGAQRYEFNYSDDELGLSLGDPIGGEYFPLIPLRDPSDDASMQAGPTV